MKKRIYKIVFASILIVALATTLAACVPPFKDAPQGISEDGRTYKKIKDARMDAEAADYKGYIYKKDEKAFCFRLKSPSTLVEGKKYPMIVYLHGSGDGGSDNSSHMFKSVIDNVAKYVNEEVFVFMPQLIKKYSWENDNEYSKGMNILYNLALDELIATKAIDTDRVYITGMSMGGYGTFFQAYNNPNKYAAIAPICGYFPDDVFSDLSTMKDLPIWLGHSKTDNVVNFAESERLYNRLITAGANDVRNTWLEDYKHDMTQPFYDNADFWQWLMSKSK